jgi:phosphoesterase RecJ-like protein
MTVKETAEVLRSQDNILILTHRRPDGDTIGSAVGLCMALRELGKRCYLLSNPDATELIAQYASECWLPEDFAPDFVLSVDIAARSLFLPAAEQYMDTLDLAIDHHPSFEGFGKYQCVDPSRAACGEIVFEICRELGPITQAVALPLYVAVSTDTGCFVYANTTAHTHAVAAALLETGIDYFAVNKRHFRTKTKKRIALESRILDGAEYFHQGRGVFLTVPRTLMEELGATERDAEDISSLATLIEGVDCGVMLRENEDGDWKLSMRTGANGRVNASLACKLLGGGGHAMAAGGLVKGTLDEAKAKVLAAIDQVKRPDETEEQG